MATKIRLQRRGRKHYAFYSIVIADSRAPRDGKFTEKIGTYNPNTNPASVEINLRELCGGLTMVLLLLTLYATSFHAKAFT